MRWDEENLFVGNIYIGCIMRVVPEKWREWDHYKKEPGPEAEEYIRRNWVNYKAYYEKHEAAPWRCWLMLSEDGEEIGKRATKEEAMNSLEAAAKEAMG